MQGTEDQGQDVAGRSLRGQCRLTDLER
jgi:hypothetical protein